MLSPGQSILPANSHFSFIYGTPLIFTPHLHITYVIHLCISDNPCLETRKKLCQLYLNVTWDAATWGRGNILETVCLWSRS